MGRPFRVLLSSPKVYACNNCLTHLGQCSDLISKDFHCKTGKAYLFTSGANYMCGPQEERQLTTGLHVVCDIFCVDCLTCVGWKYIYAYEKSQKYKEGKVILERACVVDYDRIAPIRAEAKRAARDTLMPSSGSLTAGSGSDAASLGGSSGSGSMMIPDDTSSEDE